MHIFLTATALAGTRAINRHYRIRWIQRETDLRVQGAYIFDQSNWIVFSFCSCTSQGNSCQKNTQTVNSQIRLSGIVFIFCSCTGQGTSCQKYTQTLNSQMNFSLKIERTRLIELGFELNRFSNRSILVTLLIL